MNNHPLCFCDLIGFLLPRFSPLDEEEISDSEDIDLPMPVPAKKAKPGSASIGQSPSAAAPAKTPKVTYLVHKGKQPIPASNKPANNANPQQKQVKQNAIIGKYIQGFKDAEEEEQWFGEGQFGPWGQPVGPPMGPGPMGRFPGPMFGPGPRPGFPGFQGCPRLVSLLNMTGPFFSRPGHVSVSPDKSSWGIFRHFHLGKSHGNFQKLLKWFFFLFRVSLPDCEWESLHFG